MGSCFACKFCFALLTRRSTTHALLLLLVHSSHMTFQGETITEGFALIELILPAALTGLFDGFEGDGVLAWGPV